jgi:hypothetical protein
MRALFALKMRFWSKSGLLTPFMMAQKIHSYQFRLRRQDMEDTAVPFPYARLIFGTKAFTVS